MSQRDIVFRLEGTVDNIDGKLEGGITIDIRGDHMALMSVLFSAMQYDRRVTAMLNAVTSLYRLREGSAGTSKQFQVETRTFLELMRTNQTYCAEITGAVVEFWQGAGINLGKLPDMVKRSENQ